METKKLKLYTSATLNELLAHLRRERYRVAEDTGSSWIEVDVYARYGWMQFAIWKATDALYKLDKKGAAGDDPIAISTALRHIKS